MFAIAPWLFRRHRVLLQSMRTWSGTLVMCCMCLSGIAQDVSMTVDRNEVEVADPFQLTITAIVAEGQNVDFSNQAEAIGSFQVISRKVHGDIPVEQGRRWQQIVELETYESGQLEIPGQEVVVDGKKFPSNPVTIEVGSTLEPQADLYRFREIKDPEEILPPAGTPWRLITVGTGVVIAAVLAFMMFAKRRRVEETAEDWAYQALEQLKESPVFEEPQQLIPPLSNILREYIQKRFGISAPQQTTDEFLHAAKEDARIEPSSQAELRQFLRHSDQIKFAQLIPQQHRPTELFQTVESFIRQAQSDSKKETTA